MAPWPPSNHTLLPIYVHERPKREIRLKAPFIISENDRLTPSEPGRISAGVHSFRCVHSFRHAPLQRLHQKPNLPFARTKEADSTFAVLLARWRGSPGCTKRPFCRILFGAKMRNAESARAIDPVTDDPRASPSSPGAGTAASDGLYSLRTAHSSNDPNDSRIPPSPSRMSHDDMIPSHAWRASEARGDRAAAGLAPYLSDGATRTAIDLRRWYARPRVHRG